MSTDREFSTAEQRVNGAMEAVWAAAAQEPMEFHPACLKLPKMSASERESLVASIKDGWDNRYPILTCEGKILDGRHRYQVAMELGVQPTFVEWDGRRCGGNPFRFVWTEHSARRSWLSAEQKTLVFDDCEEAAKAWDAERERIRQEANKARSEKLKGNQNAAKDPENSADTTSVSTDSEGKRRKASSDDHKGANAKADLAGTNRGAAQRSSQLKKLAAELGKPEIIEQVKAGEVHAATALKALKEEKRKKDGRPPPAAPAAAAPEATPASEQPAAGAVVCGADAGQNSGELTAEEEDAVLEAAAREYDEAVQKIMEADDKMSAAHAQIKQQVARIAALEASIVAYQNGQNAAVKLLKEEKSKTRKQSKRLDAQATRIKELEEQLARVTAVPAGTSTRKRMIV